MTQPPKRSTVPTKATEISDLSERDDDAVKGGATQDSSTIGRTIIPCIRPPAEIIPCVRNR